MNLWTIFITGLLTGGLTCLAVQGGLLAVTLAQREEQKLKSKAEKTGQALPILSFLIAKIAAYTLLGFLLGLAGSILQFSLTTRVILELFVGIFMIGTALNLLDVHPIFRYFVIQPPKFLTRLIKNQTRSGEYFAPVLLGAFTVFIPCPTTQAMMALAIGSGNAFLGATIMFVFTLGTSPLFFVLGFLATRVGGVLQARFMKIAAIAILILAVYNINNAISLTGSNYTLDNLWNEVNCTIFDFCASRAQISNPLTEATINISDSGYNPDNLTVKAGSKVTVHLVNNTGKGCVQAFTIPKLGIQKIVPVGTSDTITFTAPNDTKELAFMCGMGMFRGKINII